MSESRVPPAPLPRPYFRVVQDDSVSGEDLERVKKNLQQTISNLEGELKREREISQKLEKSGAVLQEILSAPDFKALSFKAMPALASLPTETSGTGAPANQVVEPPIEYVEVAEIELTDAELKKVEDSTKSPEK